MSKDSVGFTVALFLLLHVSLAAAADLCSGGAEQKLPVSDIVSRFSGRGYGANNLSIVSSAGVDSLRIQFPKGSIDPGSAQRGLSPLGGVGLRIPISRASRDCMELSYRIYFPADFGFGLGGKLPGLAGGVANSGGAIPNGSDGFSARLMWRKGGVGEIYAYLPDSKVWGTSLGNGRFKFLAGRTHLVREVIKLNTVGLRDGEAQLFLDGRLVISSLGLSFRSTDRLGIDVILFETFFGGSGPEWAAPFDSYIEISEISIKG